MAYLKYFILLLFASCITNNITEPDWIKNEKSNEISDEIIFKASGKSIEDAKREIDSNSEYLSSYITPTEKYKFVDSQGFYYLLYTVNKLELKKILIEKYDELYNIFLSSYSNGDSSSQIFKKYQHYDKALNTFSSIDHIIKLTKTLNIIIEDKIEIPKSMVEEKLKLVKNEIIFNVDIEGDINGIIKSGIEKEINKLGFNTSDNGIVIVNGHLFLKNTNLNNNYINKIWTFNLSIEGYNGEIYNTLSFNGRESHVNELSLDQSISILAINSAKEYFSSILK